MKEPDYLQKEQIRVLTGSFNGPEIDPNNIDWRQADVSKIKFRQDPGPQNALGLVRLDMPNEHGVYMHDTPMKPLFNQRGRAFSAGCVRVQDVFTLVEWVAEVRAGLGSAGSGAGGPRRRPAARRQPETAGARVFRLHHGLGGTRRPRRVPSRHLRPRRRARPAGQPRARPERGPPPPLPWRPSLSCRSSPAAASAGPFWGPRRVMGRGATGHASGRAISGGTSRW